MGPDSKVRLFVGGLPGDVTPEQLAQRFQPFGSVGEVQLVPEKKLGADVAAGGPPKPCRGFAYVQLAATDEAALRRCLSMVRMHGCLLLHHVSTVRGPARHA